MIHTNDDNSNTKVDETGGPCSTHRRENTCIEILVVNQKKEANSKIQEQTEIDVRTDLQDKGLKIVVWIRLALNFVQPS